MYCFKEIGPITESLVQQPEWYCNPTFCIFSGELSWLILKENDGITFIELH